jgi:DNA repair ATPase RecN
MEEDSTKEFPQDEILKTILAEFRSVKTQLTAIDNRLTALEEKVDHRLMETRPIWESVLEQLKEVNARLDKVEYRIDSLEKESKDFHSWLRKTILSLEKNKSGLTVWKNSKKPFCPVNEFQNKEG